MPAGSTDLIVQIPVMGMHPGGGIATVQKQLRRGIKAWRDWGLRG
jgi:hypothetical protein